MSIIWALGAVGAAGSWWSGAAAVAVVGLVCALAADSWVFRGAALMVLTVKARFRAGPVWAL